MKKFTLTILFLFACMPMALYADGSINLTPLPMKMTKGNGKLALPEKFTISTGNLNKECASEAEKFAELVSKITGFNIDIQTESANAFITMSMYQGSEQLGKEGYTLDITDNGIAITANEANGFYYAFQSIKKMLPANIMAEVKDTNITEYALPVVSITDAPRFEYRGFMLDVSRHYFDIEQIKRMIDVMSYYKMNRFHWHLTDDQGWRFEVKKYPRLTTVGATRNNSWSVDPEYGGYYTDEPYGPFFYTQEQCREIVAYAAERHIEVIPEVEFPGHSCAVNAAYPELSCNPNGAHSVQVNGGIFNDVLNVANPHAIQFVKDIIDEIIDVFPYKYIHIGGDETPTTAWENNAECRALMQELGLTHVRQLQSHFVRKISDYVTQKEGNDKRTIIMWNESLTAKGTDEELIKGTGGMMMCWENGQVQPCALKAAQYGMKSVITPWGPYYINRKQSRDPGEPTGAGYGDDTVEATYNYVPVPSSVPSELQKYYVGVQGTFWTEHVQSNYLLEYLALPRLIAIAETGWTPAAKKNFSDFQQRITNDTLLLNYNKYEYGRHYILGGNSANDKVMPTPSTDEKQTWYRIVTTATDARAGRCIQLLRANSDEIGTGNAKAGRLWNSAIIEDKNNEGHDYQLWAFIQDPTNPERWAIVNKAKPNGSVNGTPTAENNTGRWDYDDNNRHYDFILGDKAYTANGNNYNYSIRSQKVSDDNMCMNYAGPGQNYSINLWSNPADGNGGIWEFRPLESLGNDVNIEYPLEGTTYRIINNTERFKGWSLYDNGNNTVTAAEQAFGANVWKIVEAAESADGQSFKLLNVATGRYISSTTAPITLGETGTPLTNVYNPKSNDFSIKAGDDALYPLPERSTTNPNTLNKGGIYPQGTGWIYEKATLATYDCYDTEGNLLKKTYQAITVGEDFVPQIPEIANYTKVSHTTTADGINTLVTVNYKRTAYSVTIRCFTMDGNIITERTVPCNIGDNYSVEYPKVEFFTCIGADIEEGTTITPTEDTIIDVYYDSEGIMGSAAIGSAVTELEAGASYLIYNAKDETSRSGFLSVSNFGEGITTTNGISEANPSFIWYFEGDGNRFTVMNSYGVYIPALSRGSLVRGGDTAEEYLFTLNNDGTTWSVKGTTNNYYWNGNADNTFTGWDNGHPFIIYRYKAHPYFEVQCKCIDEEGTELGSSSRYVKGGEQYTLFAPIIEGYTLKECDTNYKDLEYVSNNIYITLTYTNGETGVEELKNQNKGNGVIYDLQGRAIEKPTKGIYIIQGKKLLVK